MAQYAKPLANLIRELSKLPGIGGKSAQRLAFHILSMDDRQAEVLANSITRAKSSMRYCSVCGNLTESDPCEICSDEKRDRTVICVVEQARDVAAMSRELITRHPDVFNYTMIWMEDITHNTARGSSTFTLSSTNKLLKQYQWTTGLKTGSTSKAKYCLSATARKDDIDLIAVVMTAPDYKVRFSDAATLLNYGYSVSALYKDANQDALPRLLIDGGVQDDAGLSYQQGFSYLDVKGNDLSTIEKVIHLPESAQAPVKAGDKAGEAVYRLNGETIGTVPILFSENVEKAVYRDYVLKVLAYFLL